MQIRFLLPNYILPFVILFDGWFLPQEHKEIIRDLSKNKYSRFGAVFLLKWYEIIKKKMRYFTTY